MVETRTKNRRWQDVDKDSVDLSDLARHFEIFNRTEGKSPKTIDWYNLALKQFRLFLAASGNSTSLGEVGETEVRGFILYLQGKKRWQDNPFMPNPRGKLAAISIQTYVRALRGFFNWLFKEDYTTANRLARLKPPKAPTRVVEILTQQESASILGCIDSSTAAGARDKAILILLLDSGLRSSELTGAQLKNVNLEGGYLKVMGKGSKERIVPFGAMAQKVLLRYLLHFRPEPFNVNIQNLFLTLDGRPLSQNTMKMVFRRIIERSGVKRLHPHLCRHTFATNYLINGGDVFSLQQILGHTTLEMVRRYVTLASAQVTVQHRKFSPMDRLSLSEAGLSRVGGRPKGATGRSIRQFSSRPL